MWIRQLALLTICTFSVAFAQQTVSQPPASLPVQSSSDDPLVTGSSASAALCSLHAILGTESGSHAIGPLTINPDCMSQTYQRHSSATASINGQTLPSSGIATIFGPSSSASTSYRSVSISTAQPTTAPLVSGSQASSSGSASTSAATPARQSNAGNQSQKPPAAAGWIARQNIAVLLFSTFALLAGVTYFLDELLGMLV